MPLFRKRKAAADQPVDPEARSPQLGIKYKDIAVLKALMDAGVDLTAPRESVYYLYAPDEAVAQGMAREAEELGFATEVHDRLPDYPKQWSVICKRNAALSPDFVRATGDFFDALASQYGSEYDGWEAAV